MNRTQLEHIIRAAGMISGMQDVIILGSQSILGQFPEIEDLIIGNLNSQILLRSMEADILIPDDETKADLIDGALGELSPFHHAHGYYAQGVDHTTAILPQGWESRLILICNANTNRIRGHCLEIHDLMIAKLAAGRHKDYEFFEAALRLDLIHHPILLERLYATALSDKHKEQLQQLIIRGFHHE